MDPRIQAGIIAFVAAMLATAITSYVNFRLARIKSEGDKKLSEWQNKREKKEQALKNLFLLKTRLSFSKIDMASSKEDIKWFNENYDKSNELISEIRMALALYFTNHSDRFEHVLRESGYYWKCYKDHLSSDNKIYDDPDSDFQRALHASLECQEVIQGIMNDLTEEKTI
jgi:hypothetical protein